MLSQRPIPSSLIRCFWLVLPSFVSRYFGHSHRKPAQITETSYLNGLRGLAALVVVIHHAEEEYFKDNDGCYGDGPPETDHFIQLPFLRLLLHGKFSVALFFIISGFALSLNPLRRIHAGHPDTAIAAFPSALFRRPLRLFLPLLPIYAVSIALVRAGWLYGSHSLTPADRADAPIPRQLSLLDEVWAGAKHLAAIPASDGKMPLYFPQGWTLKDQYAGSLLIFTCVLAFARTTPRVRTAAVGALAAYHYFNEAWVGFLFLNGMLLAEARLVRSAAAAARKDTTIVGGENPSSSSRGPLAQLLRTTAAVVLLVVPALFFGSWPSQGNPAACIGFRYFTGVRQHLGVTGSDAVAYRFIIAWAAIALVTALESLPVLQGLLNAAPLLYLGEISYSLYLVHWAVAYSVGKALALAMMAAGWARLEACVVAVGVTLVVSVWAADGLWRAVDSRAAEFARWAAGRLGI